MNDSVEDRMLKDILASPEVMELRQASLEQGLASLRRHQRRRRYFRSGLLGCGPLLLALVFFLHYSPEPLKRSRPASNRVSTTAAASGPAPVQLISDDELMALFPDRSVALIGKPGHQQLVFLDRAATVPALPESNSRLQ